MSMLLLALALISQGAVARMPMMPMGASGQAMATMDCHSQMADSAQADEASCCCDGGAMTGTMTMDCDGGCSQCQDCAHYSSSPVTPLQFGHAPRHGEPLAYLTSFDSVCLEFDERPPIA
ncbi:hypothetical protein FCL40_15435 [Ferrimonas sediminicola]|uniref:Uncharacterized protein n=1 Tax=Ferrimonas sediminicola TaxID=2569538 RepID=A0A4V6WMM3_9GAMM|nr:hypothetical protein [Ferrimonas sediminicola]TKB47604.1 hypothetical protein FCL40_15435 [Ferrimonas sediminicola]